MPTGSSLVEMIGVGDVLHLIDHGNRTHVPIDLKWNPIVHPEPSLLGLWRGVDPGPLPAKFVDPGPGAPEGATALQVELESRTETYWLVGGLPVVVEIVSERSGYTARFDFEVWRVHDRVDLDAFRTLPPVPTFR